MSVSARLRLTNRLSACAVMVLLLLVVAGCRPFVGAASPDPGLAGDPAALGSDTLAAYISGLQFQRNGSRPDVQNVPCDSGFNAVLMIAPERRVRAFDPKQPHPPALGRFLAEITHRQGGRCPLYEVDGPGQVTYLWVGRLGQDSVTARYYRILPDGRAKLVALGEDFQLRPYGPPPSHPDHGEPQARWGSTWVSCSGGCCDSGGNQIQ